VKLRALVTMLALVVAGALTALTPTAAGATSRPHDRALRTVTLAQPLTVRTAAGAPITIWTAPRVASPSTALTPTTGFGSARVLLATAKRGSWYQVSLPTRPNGSTGWVRARDVSLHHVRDELRIDLTARTLTWTRDGTIVLETPVAIGAPETPTPVGAFYVTDLLDNADDSGPYGPLSIGTSAHSDQLTDFAGGDGQIGIHGTNDPGSIGQAMSHGCVRVPNDVITQLAGSLPLGTPVAVV
jgi:lipoprotein-anchoring transpeptidase ErfK/SrfK